MRLALPIALAALTARAEPIVLVNDPSQLPIAGTGIGHPEACDQPHHEGEVGALRSLAMRWPFGLDASLDLHLCVAMLSTDFSREKGGKLDPAASNNADIWTQHRLCPSVLPVLRARGWKMPTNRADFGPLFLRQHPEIDPRMLWTP